MGKIVRLENWHTWLDRTIDEVLFAAGQAAKDSPERMALLAERNVLQEIKRQIREVQPEDRRSFDSPLLASFVRDGIAASNDIVERVGEIHDIYRMCRSRLEWPASDDFA
jgi:hypothetical protein